MLASYKFIQKLWGLHKKIKNNLSKNNNSKTDSDEISKFTNQLINKINGNLEKFNYNVFIANMYETYNFLSQKINNPINKKIVKVTEAELTYVALDENRRPRKLPNIDD